MKVEYKCTNCNGDATVAYTAHTVTRGKNKVKEKPSWGGLIQPGERICLPCGKKRGIKNFLTHEKPH